MKFIVTGATGLVGAAVLKHCIARSEISSIVVITRKPIPAELANHAKVTAIVHEDYLTYPEDLIDKCRGAEVCLWCVSRLLPVLCLSSARFPLSIKSKLSASVIL